jgi:hypothetical protein
MLLFFSYILMTTASYRFYAGLNEYLPAFLRQRRFMLLQRRGSSIMDILELLGIPPAQVELVLVNGEPEDFSCIVQVGDRVSIYPEFCSLDIAPLGRQKHT